MRKLDLAIGVLVSVGFHAGVAASSYIGAHHGKTISEAKPPPVIIADLRQYEEEPPPPPPDPSRVASQGSSADTGESAAASLPEPMNVAAVSDITTVIRPTPPVAPKADSNMFVPPSTQNRTQINTKAIPNFVDFNLLDRKPEPRNTMEPVYPYDMKRQGIDGQVTLRFIVDEKGYVLEPYVVRSSQNEFAKPALDAIIKWRFSSGMKNGRAVKTIMELPIAFKITQD